MPASCICGRFRQWSSNSSLVRSPWLRVRWTCFAHPGDLLAGNVSARMFDFLACLTGPGMLGPVQTSGALSPTRGSPRPRLDREPCGRIRRYPPGSRSLASSRPWSGSDARVPPCRSACASSMIARYTSGWSFGHGAFAIVDPDLHELHAPRASGADPLTAFFDGGRAR